MKSARRSIFLDGAIHRGGNSSRHRLMMPLLCVLFIGAAAVGAESPARTPAPAPAQRPTRPPTYEDRYGILAEHNIFVRDRSRLASSHGGGLTPSTQPSGPRSPEESLALRGVVIEEGALRAYVEDTSSGKVLRLSPGDAVARGKVSDIDIDALQYEQNGRRQWIMIGDDFTGHPAIAGRYYVGPAAGAATAPASLPFDPNDPNLTLEQKMKLRRMQGK